MSMQVKVAALKQHLEELFPGKWLVSGERARHIKTGLVEIDNCLSKGIARKRITQWIGPMSSGKTTVLKAMIQNLCKAGLNIAYVDAEGRLLASDWVFADRKGSGKVWIARPEEKRSSEQKSAGIAKKILPFLTRKSLLLQEAIWSCDQFIRSNAFDLVVLDLGAINLADGRGAGAGYKPLPSKVYGRLQRALDKSKAALIVVNEIDSSFAADNDKQNRSLAEQANGWGCHTSFHFSRGAKVNLETGLNGVVMITPNIFVTANRDGMAQKLQLSFGAAIQNRLFTHPQVPDRRIRKS